MRRERTILNGILCKCTADKEEITFTPEFGKKMTFTYAEILAVKSREGTHLRHGRLAIVGRDGKSISIKVLYKDNRALKRMLLFLMEYVPGDVTFRKLNKEEEKHGFYIKKNKPEPALCPRCHSTDIQMAGDEKWSDRILRSSRMICRKCGHQFSKK